MGDAGITLTYGRPQRRRWRRAVVVAVVLVGTGVAAAGWRYRGPVSAYVGGRYADWRFSRAFDRAKSDLMGNGDTWLAPVAGAAADGRADHHLRVLLARAPRGGRSYYNSDGILLFVRTGMMAGDPWLAFVTVGRNGLEMLVFKRDRGTYGNGLLMTTPGLVERHTVSYVLRSIESHRATVRATIDIDGGRNEVLWTFDADAVPGVYVGGAPVEVPCTVTPRTGWASPPNWWPQPGNWRLINGPKPSRDLASDGGVAAVSFLPDGRVAAAGPFRVSLIDPEESDGDRKPPRHPFPLDLSPSEVFVFSLDGTKLFVGGISQAAALIDVTNGRARRYAYSTSGPVRAAFADERTLLAMDQVRWEKLDWDSLRREPIDVEPEGMFHGFGAAGERVAIPSKSDVVVRDLKAESDVAHFETPESLQQLSLSSDGQRLAMKGRSDLRLCDVESGAVVWEHAGDGDLDTPYSQVKWTADGTRGAAAGKEHVYVWSLAEPRWVARFPHGLAGESFAVALSPDGRRLAASTQGSKTIAYWPDVDAAVGDPSQD